MKKDHLDKLFWAAEENNWTLRGIKEFRRREGQVPNGIVLIEREEFPFPEKAYATAAYAIRGMTAAYGSGHYDLTEIQAREDFGKRALAL